MNYSESKRIEATCRACDMIEAALPEVSGPTSTDWELIELVGDMALALSEAIPFLEEGAVDQIRRLFKRYWRAMDRVRNKKTEE